MYDIIVVGAGLAGSVVARKCAEELNKKVLVLERRNHIAGNLYDEKDKNGILIQKYGPHFFGTNQWWIMEYMMRFGEWYAWQPRAMSYVDGKYLWRPYNFHTLQQLVGPENSMALLQKLRENFKGQKKVSIYELTSCSDPDIAAYGTLLYEKLFVPYCAKQWGLKPNEIDKAVVDRAKISLGYDWQLTEDLDFQYLPKEGYMKVISNMLQHDNIEVKLETDAVNELSFSDTRVAYKGDTSPLIVYTGELDQLFRCQYGELPYRSRYFEFITFENKDFELPVEVITYPQNEAYLRRTEFKRFNYLNEEMTKTVVADEYSMPYNKTAEKGNEPYYPVINKESKEMYEKYWTEVQRYENLMVCGRLAEFKYLDMDSVVEKGFEIFEKIKKQSER